MRALLTALFLSVGASALWAANTLDIYAIDSEGKAVLTIAPSGETMLEDLGWTSFGNRPATTNQVVDALNHVLHRRRCPGGPDHREVIAVESIDIVLIGHD